MVAAALEMETAPVPAAVRHTAAERECPAAAWAAVWETERALALAAAWGRQVREALVRDWGALVVTAGMAEQRVRLEWPAGKAADRVLATAREVVQGSRDRAADCLPPPLE